MNIVPVSTNEPRPIFVIGSLVVACSARVLRCPSPGETLRATGFIMEAGGKGFNLAMAAHRLGVSIDGLFAVGEDAAGDFMRAAFAKVGLRPELILTVKGATGAGVGLIEGNGENRIAVFPGANDELSEADATAAADRVRTACLVMGQFEAPDAPIMAAFAIAKQAGTTTLLNPSPYRPISPGILGNTDILVVNQSEVQAVAADLGIVATGQDPQPYAAIAQALGVHGVGTLIVTLGQDGAVLWHDGKFHEQPGFPVDAVDSIGAGDAFTGGLIAALVTGRGYAEALRWGCAAGALTVAKLGLGDALPDFPQLADFLDDRTATA